MSVLTDEKFFYGGLEDLIAVRRRRHCRPVSRQRLYYR